MLWIPPVRRRIQPLARRRHRHLRAAAGASAGRRARWVVDLARPRRPLPGHHPGVLRAALRRARHAGASVPFAARFHGPGRPARVRGGAQRHGRDLRLHPRDARRHLRGRAVPRDAVRDDPQRCAVAGVPHRGRRQGPRLHRRHRAVRRGGQAGGGRRPVPVRGDVPERLRAHVLPSELVPGRGARGRGRGGASRAHAHHAEPGPRRVARTGGGRVRPIDRRRGPRHGDRGRRVTRPDGRDAATLRPVAYELGYQEWAAGSILLSMGKTRVLCAASVSDDTPRWLRGTGKGWVTGEYSMLPAATSERSPREVNRGRPGGRTQEIQRLIGRALRAVTDLGRLGERVITVDCDVLQADAGTRTASITGGYIALALAVRGLEAAGTVPAGVLADSVAAVSVGIVDGRPILDLCYEEDAGAQVDCNVVMTGTGKLVEVQGTAEGEPFDRADMDALLDLAAAGIEQLTKLQHTALG